MSRHKSSNVNKYGTKNLKENIYIYSSGIRASDSGPLFKKNANYLLLNITSSIFIIKQQAYHKICMTKLRKQELRI